MEAIIHTGGRFKNLFWVRPLKEARNDLPKPLKILNYVERNKTMIKTFLNKKIFLLLIFLIFFSCLALYKIGVPSIFEEDEAKLAEISREIVITGKWVDIQHNFSPNFHKPPLYNWVTVSAFKVFGINEFAVRFWAALFGLGTLIITFFLASLIFDKKIGLLSTVILGSSFMFLILNRMGLVDTGLTFFVSLTLLLFLVSYLNKKQRYLLSFTGITAALGLLTKGPLGIILPAATVFCYLIYKKDFTFFKQYFKEILIATILFFAVGLPWWVIEYNIHGTAFLQGLFGQFMLGIYFNEFQKHAEPIYFYFLVILIGMLPWSIHSYYGLGISLKKEFRNKSAFFLIWFLIVFVLFSFAKTKIPSYSLPLFPPLAIITAVGINYLLLNTKKKLAVSKFITFGGLMFLFAALLIVAFLVKVDAEFSAIQTIIKLFLGSSLILSCLGFIFSYAKNKTLRFYFSLGSLFLITLVFYYMSLTYFLPFYENFKPSKEAALSLKKAYPNADFSIYTFDEWRLSSFVFYLNAKKGAEVLRTEKQLVATLKSKSPAVIFIGKNSYQTLKSKIPLHKLINVQYDSVTITNLK